MAIHDALYQLLDTHPLETIFVVCAVVYTIAYLVIGTGGKK